MAEDGDDAALEIHLYGKVPGKKNMYTPRADKPGVFKSSRLQTEIDRLAIQVPGAMRDLRLVHPDLELEFTVTPDGQGADRDGKLVCILDILVQMGTIVDDNIRHCNGTITLRPSRVGEMHETKIWITPRR